MLDNHHVVHRSHSSRQVAAIPLFRMKVVIVRDAADGTSLGQIGTKTRFRSREREFLFHEMSIVSDNDPQFATYESLLAIVSIL